MKLRLHAVLLAFAAATPLLAQTTTPASSPPANPLTQSLPDALAKGKFSLDARLRWEYADQQNLRSSNAFLLSTRFGFTSAPVGGFQGMVEGENIAVIGNSNNYNAAGTNPGNAKRTVIADPPVTDLNQAWLSYTHSGATVKGGRQRIVIDNARFVGDVGWRMNQQTFDAATLTARPADDLTVFYGYVWRVSRVFGNKSPQPDFVSKSHLINASYGGWPYGKITAYAYLLDFTNSAANSSDTYGGSFVGAAPVTKEFKITYRAEAATQSDAGNNPLHYTARYYVGELGGAIKPFDFGAGYEVLGSDHGKKGFATPLATLHAFNGWADEFLATPANGLRDFYVSAGAALPGGFPLKVIYHKFSADYGSHNYGNEWDALISHKFGKYWTVLAKAAHYDGKPPFFDTDKLWLQTEFTF